MLGNLRISYKLLMMIGVSIFGIAAVAAVGLSELWSNLLEDRKAKLQDVVLLTRQALDLNYLASRQAGLSEAEALERGKACCANSASARTITSMPLTRKGWSWLTQPKCRRQEPVRCAGLRWRVFCAQAD
jgi:hypothetical protein